jgi:glutathione S-transferase
MDPLYEAWSLLREARRVPIDMGIEFWAREVAAMMHRVCAAIAQHAEAMEGDGSPLLQRTGGDAETARGIQEELAEHQQLASATAEVLATLESSPIDRGVVFVLAERLIELEIAVARHLNRLHELLGRQPWHV